MTSQIPQALRSLAEDSGAPAQVVPALTRGLARARRRRRARAIAVGALALIATTGLGVTIGDRMLDERAGTTATAPERTSPDADLPTGADPNKVKPRTPAQLAKHGIILSAPTGQPIIDGDRLARQMKFYHVRDARLDATAELYNVTITHREARSRVGIPPPGGPVTDRLAWVVTLPWRFYAVGGDIHGFAGRPEQQVAIVDATDGRLLVLDAAAVKKWGVRP